MNSRMKSFAYDIDTAVKDVLDGGITYDGLIEEVGEMEHYLPSEQAWAQETLQIMVRPSFIAQVLSFENDHGIVTIDATWMTNAELFAEVETHMEKYMDGTTFWKVLLTYYSPNFDKWSTLVLRDEVIGEDF